MAEYRFDRSAFKIVSFEEADAINTFDKNVPYGERLRQAYYLISQAYAFPISAPPKMDKSYFVISKADRYPGPKSIWPPQRSGRY